MTTIFPEEAPYFDEDDLINDYAENFEETLEEEIRDGLDVIEETNRQQEQTENFRLEVEERKVSKKKCEPVDLFNSRNASIREQENLEKDVPMKEIQLRPVSEDNDLYSFERYNSRWRSEKRTVESAFEVKKWKRQSKLSNKITVKQDISALKRSALNSSNSKLLQHHRHFSHEAGIRLKLQNGISKIPTEGVLSVNMTLRGGVRVFVNKSKSSEEEFKGKNRNRPISSSDHLLGVSIETLMMKADALLRKFEIERKFKKSIYQEELPKCRSLHSLWVDKHAPSYFSHLLTDEQTNREVLYAIRAWDPYVFGCPAPKPSVLGDEEKYKNKISGEKKDLRPDATNRVVLLSGPPGIGKTTLALIIAKHAGYNALEVNASDDRSASTLREKVLRGMESTTLNFGSSSGRPNCLILDEADGVDARSAISSLVDIIRAEVPESGSRKNRKTPILRRPIIFICNHKYAPTLRPLLPFCRHFAVDPPSNNRLVGRLREILMKEKFSVSSTSLLQRLVTSSGGDIRFSLHALQFAASEATRDKISSTNNDSNNVVEISPALKSGLNGNWKDARTDLVSTISSILQKRKNTKKRGTVLMVLRAVESFGNITKTLDCLFSNLTNLSYVDPTMEKCVVVHEWLSCVDHQFLVNSGNQTLLKALAAGATHVLCGVEMHAKQELNYSNRELSNAFYSRESNKGIINKFLCGLPPRSKMMSYQHAVIEVVPFALWMLSAGTILNRPVSSFDLLSKKEKVAFEAHVTTLRALGLTYVNSYDSLNDSQEMKLEPEIDCLVRMKGCTFAAENQRKDIPSALRELLAHKVQLEIIQHREEPLLKSPSSNQRKQREQEQYSVSNDMNPLLKHDSKRKLSSVSIVQSPHPHKKTKKAQISQNFLGIGAQKAKAARAARKKALVGFRATSTEAHSGSGLLLKQVIRFKYQKGFTQAVRTPCHIKDFL